MHNLLIDDDLFIVTQGKNTITCNNALPSVIDNTIKTPTVSIIKPYHMIDKPKPSLKNFDKNLYHDFIQLLKRNKQNHYNLDDAQPDQQADKTLTPPANLGSIMTNPAHAPTCYHVWQLHLNDQKRYFLLLQDYKDYDNCQSCGYLTHQEIARFNKLIDLSSLGLLQVDANWRCTYANPAWEELCGINCQGLDSQGLLALLHESDQNIVKQSILSSMRDKKAFQVEVRVKSFLGMYEWVMIQSRLLFTDQDEFAGAILLLLVTSGEHETESKLISLAMRDTLTGLHNRYYFQEKVTEKIKKLQPSHNFSLFYIDLDGFKAINDAYGHSTGDSLLIELSKRLQEAIRPCDLVARLGGDEFAFLIRYTDTVETLKNIAQAILHAASKPFSIGQGIDNAYISSSMGIAHVMGDNLPDFNNGYTVQDYAERLMIQADTAMYYAKGSGGNSYCFYNETMDKKAIKQVELANYLHVAMVEKKFVLFYQPQVDSFTRDIFGFEALLRLPLLDINPDLAHIGADEFIPLLESKGLMRNLGYWIIEQSIADHAHLISMWSNSDLPHISINISPSQFQDTGLVDYVAMILAKYAIKPELVIFELTETVLMENKDEIRSQCKAFKRLGLSVALDDFGTGYSSLSHLHSYPIDIIKIDRSFVHDIHSHEAAQIILSIISLGKALGKQVIAEGVECDEQVALLHEYGCDLMQGWLFSKALPINDVIVLGATKTNSSSDKVPVKLA